MQNFLVELRSRNKILYWFGWYNFLFGMICIALMTVDSQQILGVSRWLKPMKFFTSVWIMVWTMGWILHHLYSEKAKKTITWLIVISMFAENAIITLQSYRGQQSHFNVKQPLDGILFGIMGLMIVVFTFTIIYVTILFFFQKNIQLPEGYLTGIRLGLICFLIFSIEGGMMINRFSHTVGAADGSEGFPLVNWSKASGDLRIAHFFGMHSLQILPLAGWYLFKSKKQVIIFSSIYFIFVSFLFIQAMAGLPITKFSLTSFPTLGFQQKFVA